MEHNQNSITVSQYTRLSCHNGDNPSIFPRNMVNLRSNDAALPINSGIANKRDKITNNVVASKLKPPTKDSTSRNKLRRKRILNNVRNRRPLSDVTNINKGTRGINANNLNKTSNTHLELLCIYLYINIFIICT